MATNSSIPATTLPGTTSAADDTSSILSSISSAVSSSIVNSETAPTTAPPPAAPTTSEAPPPDATEPTPAPPPPSTSTLSLSPEPPTTQVITSVVTTAPSSPGEPNTPVTVVITQTPDVVEETPTTAATTGGGLSSTSTSPALNTGSSSGNGDGGNGGGLSTAATTAIAVVVPVVVVAGLVIAAILLWRRRKAKKQAEEQRRKEVEDYGFNPNNDPTLPTVASENGAEMSEDNSGYRGWGAAGAASRKMSTTLTSGHTQGQLSDAGSNGYPAGSSHVNGSDGHSGDAMLHQRRETMNSDDLGSLGQGPIAGAHQQGGMMRGPSNASSTYSAAGRSDVSDPPPGGMPQQYEAYNPNNGYGYSQHGPYGDGSYGGAGGPDMPIVQDVSARRNTRIQQAGNFQQGNSGIAQNF